MGPTSEADQVTFRGDNWQDLNRLVALAKFHFTQENDDDVTQAQYCAYLAQRFSGPALDWVAMAYSTRPALFANFDRFVIEVRQSFGVADNNITALLRRDLDQLAWNANVPVFFSEFDRLTLGLDITSNETRVAMVEQKLPQHMKKLLAEQALSFSNYDTMRERLNCMWALDPTRGKTMLVHTAHASRPRCGRCGRRGHAAPECRGQKK